MAKYLFLLYEDEAWYTASDEDKQRILAGHGRFTTAHGERILGGSALQPQATATTLRRRDETSYDTTDGPFAETKEALGGFYLVEADDLDRAIEMARMIPTLTSGGIEVRPVLAFD